jgi:hypothetical protein
MKLVDYLGNNLKDDELVELLEHYDMSVIYDFDRLHENTPDSYSSSAEAAGIELRFNERQALETIWCYVKARDGFAPVDPNEVGVQLYSSFIEAKSAAESSGVKISQPPPGSNMEGQWIRFDRETLWIHYQFLDGELALVTLMLPWK